MQWNGTAGWCIWTLVAFLSVGRNGAQGGEAGYKAIDVARNGGSVSGVVRLNQSVADQRVPTGKDDKICGPTAALSRLSTGQGRGVRNAVVYIEKIPEGKPFSRATKFLLDQKQCMYSPHVMVMPFGASLEIVNSDPVLHNVHISELGTGSASVVNIAQPIKGQKSILEPSRFKKPGFYVATCDAGHPWMSAYIMVAEHPYYAVTDARGNYSIKDIPPGQYQLVMWHEGIKVSHVDEKGGKPIRYDFEDPYVSRMTLTIEKGHTARADFEIAPR